MLERLISLGLVDITRELDPSNGQLFTWWPPRRNLRQRNTGWRLDYVLVSQSLSGQIASCKVLAEIGMSDHAPVMMTFVDGSLCLTAIP